MSDIDTARQKLMRATECLDSAGGHLSVAIDEVQTAQAMARDAAEGASGAASVEEGVGMLAQAETDLETARQAVFAARNGMEETANRL